MRKKKIGGAVVTVLAILVIAALVLLGLHLIQKDNERVEKAEQEHAQSIAEAPKDARGEVVSVSPEDELTEQELQAMEVEPEVTYKGDPLRMTIPAVDFDYPVGSLKVASGIINPPTFTQIYTLRNRGVTLEQASEGTVFMAAHSISGGWAPGNHLINVDNQAARVKPGDEIQVGDLTYVISATDIIPKPRLATNNRVWNNEPERLVVITCMQRSSGRSVNNFVVYADLKH